MAPSSSHQIHLKGSLRPEQAAQDKVLRAASPLGSVLEATRMKLMLKRRQFYFERGREVKKRV